MSDATVSFRCNICNASHGAVPATSFGREDPSCSACGSSVRMRGIVHHVSTGLFGQSLPLSDFPLRMDVTGIGLSDWPGYANGLAARFHYTNTFYHQAPFLDIVAPPAELYGTCDFVISSDVFEHVPPPVERAFAGAMALLKPNGLFVLTVPFTDVVENLEHFPELATYKVVEFEGQHVLINRDAAGQYNVREGLIFHGGPGDTLEMRVFSRHDTVRLLRGAGFEDIQVHEGVVPEWGILPPHHHGLPITARRPLHG